jgi:quercetin dioxygenase-like cupin family protein
MALHHAPSGEIVDLRPLGSDLPHTRTAALVKSDSFEAIRLVLKAGETLPEHKVAGEFTLHCLEGEVILDLPEKTVPLAAQQWVYVDAGVTHGLRAIEPSSLLLTILLPA